MPLLKKLSMKFLSNLKSNPINTRVLLSVLISILSFIFYQTYADYSSQTIFSSRDLQRAIEILSLQKMHWLGPEVSGGGNLPGPIMYLLLATFKGLFRSLDSYYFYIFFQSLANGILFYFLMEINVALALLGFSLVFTSSWNFLNLTSNLNPAMMGAIFILSLIQIAKFYLKPSDTRASLIWLGSLVAIGLQFHGSILFLLGSFLLFELLSFLIDRNRKKNLEFKHLSYILTPIAISLIPWFLKSTFTPKPTSWTQYGNIAQFSLHQLLLTLFYQSPWLVLLVPVGILASAMNRSFALLFIAIFSTNLPALYLASQSFFFSRFVGAFHFLVLGWLLACIHYIGQKYQKFTLVYLQVTFLIGSMLTIYLISTMAPQLKWNGNSMGLFVVSALILYLSLKILNWKKQIFFIGLLLGTPITMNLQFPEDSVKNRNSDLRECLIEIYQISGLNYEGARSKLYLVGNFSLFDFRFLYPEGPSVRPIDDTNFILTDGSPISLSSPFQEEPTIRPLTLKTCGKYKLLRYNYEGWIIAGNMGSPYQLYPSLKYRQAVNLIDNQVDLVQRADREFQRTMLLNCGLKSPDCQSGIYMTITKANSTYQISYSIFGIPLSQLGSWINPTWTESWEDIKFVTKCKGLSKIHKVPNIGFFKSGQRGKASPNFLAPFLGKFELDCRGSIQVGLSIGKRSYFSRTLNLSNSESVRFEEKEVVL